MYLGKSDNVVVLVMLYPSLSLGGVDVDERPVRAPVLDDCLGDNSDASFVLFSEKL